MIEEGLAQIKRQGLVLLIYRWILGAFFLFVAFSDFPAHKWTIGVAYLVFALGVEAIITAGNARFLATNRLDDIAERKTRHTVALAALRGESPGPHFWSDVDERVESELRAAQALHRPPAWWKRAGLVSGALLFRIAADLVGFAVMAAITPSY
jgi:hypothetical protein